MQTEIFRVQSLMERVFLKNKIQIGFWCSQCVSDSPEFSQAWWLILLTVAELFEASLVWAFVRKGIESLSEIKRQPICLRKKNLKTAEIEVEDQL